jgi:Zn finger protein HypA/HybF involved in hydrogenase expression
MSYYKPSTPAIERSSLVPDEGPTIVCRTCGDTMKHFRTIARLGVRPEQFMFRCPSCKGVATKELKRVA